jgi:hypothetical protein
LNTTVAEDAAVRRRISIQQDKNYNGASRRCAQKEIFFEHGYTSGRNFG